MLRLSEKLPKNKRLNGPKLKSLKVRTQHRGQMSMARKRHRNKRAYGTFAEAEDSADRRNSRSGLRFHHVSAYFCPYCRSYHIGRDGHTRYSGRPEDAERELKRNLVQRLIWSLEEMSDDRR